MPKWHEGTITKIEEESPQVRRFWLAPPEEVALDFKAGQFITMDLPIGTKRLERWRSYSIASPPQERPMELCIVQLKGGNGTRYLFEEIAVGATIRFKGPSGAFTLPERIEHELIFVCTGTGVAPFRSMIQQIRREGKDHKGIHLIFGCRRKEDILYRAEFEALLETMPNFRYSVALSREDPIRTEDYPFPVAKGYVHQLYQTEYATPREDRSFYLCGWSAMVDQAVENIVNQMGYPARQCQYELYG